MVSLKTFYKYFTAGGSILLLAVTLLFLLLGEVSSKECKSDLVNNGCSFP